MSTRLYELTEMHQEVYDLLVENGGELTPEIEERLNLTAELLSDKLEGIGWLLKEITDRASVYADTSKKYADKSKTLTASADRLKRYVAECLEHAEIGKVRANHFTFSLVQNPVPNVEWTGNADDLPINLCTSRVVVTLDRQGIIARYKETGEIPEGLDIRYGKHVRIGQ